MSENAIEKPNAVQELRRESTILTTTVGSYPLPDWLLGAAGETAVVDATRVIFDTQRQAGIDLPTDGELYRFDINHPETNGMIEYFVRPMGGDARGFWAHRSRGISPTTCDGFSRQTRCGCQSRTHRRHARSVVRLRACGGRGGWAIQIYPDQPLYARPNPARQLLR